MTQGVVLRRKWPPRGGLSFAWGEILSAERMASGRGFRLHVLSGEAVAMIVGKDRRRGVERALRDGGIQIVDEYGARIDESQFEKEADPEFVQRCVAEYKRSVGQWSDDA